MSLRSALLLLALLCTLATGAGAQECGDCDGDGRIGIGDALRAARIAVGLLPPPTAAERALCDVSGDGLVGLPDVLLIAQAAIERPGVVLECPPQGVPYDAFGTQPLVTRIADVNMDGDVDVLVGLDPPGITGGGVNIFYGATDPMTGTTSIERAMMPMMESVPSVSGSGVSEIFVGDVDGDGLTDMVTLEFETLRFAFYPGIQACPGTNDSFGMGILSDAPPLGVNAISSGQLYDMDADGDLDFVFVGSLDRIHVARFDRNAGTFSDIQEMLAGQGVGGPCTLLAPFDPVDIAVGDFTNNGMPGIAAAYAGGSAVVIFQQRIVNLVDFQSAGMGTFERHRDTFWSSCTDNETMVELRAYTTAASPGANFPARVHSGDLDRDGWLDVVTISSPLGSVSTLLNNQDGTFAAPTERDFGIGPIALTLNSQLIDLNQDGVLDLVVSSEAADVVVFLAGQSSAEGEFTFADPRPFITTQEMGPPANPAGFDAADLDEDGANDLAVATTRTGEYQIIKLTAFGGRSAPNFISFNTAISYEADTEPVDIASGFVLGGDTFADILVPTTGGLVDLFSGSQEVGAGLNFPPLQLTLPPTTMPTAIATGDLDTMFEVDFALADGANDRVLVYFHTGGTSLMTPPFTQQPILDLPPGCAPADIVIGNVLPGGANDILVACRDRNSVVGFAQVGTSGTFMAAQEFDTSPSLLPGRACDPANFAGCGPEFIVIADTDGVNGPDVLTGNNYSFDISVLLNDGMTIALEGEPIDVPATGSPFLITGLCATDFDENGTLDYAVAATNFGGGNSHIYIFEGDGAGRFVPPSSTSFFAAIAAPLGLSDMRCRDLDADGDEDLVISSRTGIVSVIRNQLDLVPLGEPGLVYDPLNCPAGGNPEQLVIDDVSGDGSLDILTANPPDSITYIPGRPGGEFLCTLVQGVPGGGLRDISVGRVDIDEHEDIVAVQNGGVVILYGTGQSGEDEFSFADDVFEFDPVQMPEMFVLDDPSIAVGRSGNPLATVVEDFDLDGDRDIAVLYGSVTVEPFLGQQYSGPGVEIFWNTDEERRGEHTRVISDSHPLVTFTWLPTLPLLDENGSTLPSVFSNPTPDRFFEHAADLQAVDVNRDGLKDMVVLLPDSGAGAYLIVTLTPGITGSPDDPNFGPSRFIDWQGVTLFENPCSFHFHEGGTLFGTRYSPAVILTSTGACTGITDPRITQFSFNLGPIEVGSVDVTDAFPQDGDMEIVVTDRTNSMLRIFTCDHDAPLMTPGRAELEGLAVDPGPDMILGTPDDVLYGAPPFNFPTGMIADSGITPMFSNGPSDAAFGDLNDNGRPDAGVSIFSDGPPVNRGAFAGADPGCTGTPGAPLEFAGRRLVTHADVGDYNRDGKVDGLAVSDQGEVASAFYFDPTTNPTLSTFLPRIDHVLGAGQQSDLVRGDFNNDGRLDVVISNDGAGLLTILFGVGGL